MAGNVFTRSFAGGEISSELYGRIDLTQYQTGLAGTKNVIVQPHGPAKSRRGSKLIAVLDTESLAVSLTAEHPTREYRFIPFVFNNSQAYALLLTQNKNLVFSKGAQVIDGASPSTFSYFADNTQVADLHYTQSADVLTIVHPDKLVQELRRTSATHFEAVFPDYGTIDPVTGLVLIKPSTSVSAYAPSPPANYSAKVQQYTITVWKAGIGETPHKIGQTEPMISNDLTIMGFYNAVSASGGIPQVPPVELAPDKYIYYKKLNGSWGYIGEQDYAGTAISPDFRDYNIVPDTTRQPPEANSPLGTVLEPQGGINNPSAVTYFAQRRCFAGSRAKPQHFWATVSGTENNFNVSSPTRDDDAITIRIVSGKVSRIKHLVSLTDLLVLTEDGEAIIYTQNSDVFSPLTVAAKTISYHGATNVQPVLTGDSALYVRAQSGRVAEILYDGLSTTYKSNDVCLTAPHLFDGHKIIELTVTRTPFVIVWALRDDGVLLGMTYNPTQKVWAWHKHSFTGQVKAICGIPNGDNDVLYLCVVRDVNVSQVPGVFEKLATVEYLEFTDTTTFDDAFCVDSGVTYQGTATAQVTGLDHLEGLEVAILADGNPHPRRVVTDGTIDLDFEATKVVIGLPAEAEITTLPPTVEVEAFGQGTVKNVNQVKIRVQNTGSIEAGPKGGDMTAYQSSLQGDYGVSDTPLSGFLDITITPTWNSDGQVTIRSVDPLPMTILSVTTEIAVGG